MALLVQFRLIVVGTESAVGLFLGVEVDLAPGVAESGLSFGDFGLCESLVDGIVFCERKGALSGLKLDLSFFHGS